MEPPRYVTSSNSPKILAIDPNCNDDPFYRYKMTQLMIQTPGNNKTLLLNINKISHDLGVSPEHIVYYLGKELGTRGCFHYRGKNDKSAYFIGNIHNSGIILYSCKIYTKICIMFKMWSPIIKL